MLLRKHVNQTETDLFNIDYIILMNSLNLDDRFASVSSLHHLDESVSHPIQ